ncbi:hypothetical protein NQZ79_g2877 [Umbelopsis isabellina]|nr:hypothetical protein NQZ79_g2877 [Umbelopsis isabellina]
MSDGIINSTLSHDNQSIVSITRNHTTIIRPVNTTGKVELKIGVLLPFAQVDDEWTRVITVSGMSAIRMAAAEINSQQLIPGAYITLIEKDSYPDEENGQSAITEAVYSAVTLIQQGVIGVIGDISSSWTSLSSLMTSTLQIPQCSFSAGAISEHAIMQAKTSDIRVVTYQAFRTTGGHSNIMTVLDQFAQSGARIVIVAADTPQQVSLLTIAANMGYVNDDFVWLTIGAIDDELYNGTQRFNNLIKQRQNGTLAAAPPNATALSLAARLTENVSTIDYNKTFNGMISFDIWLDLQGYPEYDAFLDRWSHLDPVDYPLAGRDNTSGNEGLAYSCMMLMALGFNNTMHNVSRPIDEALVDLAKGNLGHYMTPLSFNTSYMGPQGPMQIDANGDVTRANFLIYNIQNGKNIVVGSSTSHGFNITAPILYHDGTIKRPADAPPKILLNPGYTSPIAVVVLAVSGIGILFSIVTMFIVIIFRNRQIFKASSPVFCVLELMGFLLTYVSLLFMIGTTTVAGCYIVPVTFHLGYCLIMGNMVVKNFRIFRIFNNIFITRTIVTDGQLFKASASMVVIDIGLLSLWLGLSTVKSTAVDMTHDSYYQTCAYLHPTEDVFMGLMATFCIGLLVFATFLAIKTRRVGASYSKYSETKQIGICVYNILFAGLIGFIVFFLPTAGYITRYYVTVITILWGTTFSLYTLFLPKMWNFFRGNDDSSYNTQTNSNGSGSRRKEEDDWRRTHTTLSAFQSDHSITNLGDESELFSLEQILAHESNVKYHRKGSIGSTHSDAQGNTIQGFVEVHEGTLPLRRIHKYFPFLAHWEMQDIMVFPTSGYFSHFSVTITLEDNINPHIPLTFPFPYQHLTNHGQVFAYKEVSIFSSESEAYILKIHGTGYTDIHIQVETMKDLEDWRHYFRTKGQGLNSANNEEQVNSLNTMELLRRSKLWKASEVSDLSQIRLLDRQNSDATLCSSDTMLDQHDLEHLHAHTSSYLQLPARYDELSQAQSSTARRRRSTSLEAMYFQNHTDLSIDRLLSFDEFKSELSLKNTSSHES